MSSSLRSGDQNVKILGECCRGNQADNSDSDRKATEKYNAQFCFSDRLKQMSSFACLLAYFCRCFAVYLHSSLSPGISCMFCV